MSKYDSLFHKDFFPTPSSVLDLMMIDFKNEIVLEPSAGKGDIIDYAKDRGAKDVLFCEINDDLASICKSKARFIKSDFLQVQPEEISHISLIVMNPPFSEAGKHIEHAWKIASQGCQVVSLCNTDMLENWRYERSELKNIVHEYGNEIKLGNVFNIDAERKTDVNISCIKLFKPIYNDNMNFEGFYLDEEPEYHNQNGIIKYNEIQALVNNYICALKVWDEFKEVNDKMNRLCYPVGMKDGFKFQISYNQATVQKDVFAKELQKQSWLHIFKLMNLSKYMTSGVMEDINRFVENQSKIPFTVRNVYRMIEVILGTSQSNFNRALVESVDELTKHTHENRYNIEGWKTNCGWMLNKKFIIDWIFEMKWSGGKMQCRYNSNTKKLEDLEKVLCNITGSNYSDVQGLQGLIKQTDGIEPNKWYSNGFFEVKGFKKGTANIKFKNNEHWELLNRTYAELKGFTLFEGKAQSKYEDKQTGRDQQEKSYMPSFLYTAFLFTFDPMQSTPIKLSLLKPNTGQIEGLPKNPRFIRDERYKSLVQSITDDPEMLELRELIVYPLEKSFVVIAGNMRLRAMQDLGFEEAPCKVLPIETPADKLRAYSIKDNVPYGENELAQLNSDWDRDELISFGMEMVDDEVVTPEAVEDDFVMPNEIKTDIVLGDLCEIGRHRLLCGDSTNSDDVARLMNGEKADMVFTDPPYGYSYESNRYKKGNPFGALKNDDRVLEFLPNVELFTKENVGIYICGSFQTIHKWIDVISEAFNYKNLIVWKKNSWSMGDLEGAYAGQHELIVYAHKGRITLIGGRDPDVWEYDRQRASNHPTQKPVKLVAYAISKTISNGIVLDFFVGSGTTMIAANELGVKCYGLDIDPKYCQVTIDRMLQLDPTLEIKKNGQPYTPPK